MKTQDHHTPLVFEFDGQIHRCERDQLVPVARLQDIEGDAWLITDFGQAMSRFMSVEGPVKYAEVLVRRKLQESGEFEEPVEIITHWKRKKDKHTTDIFFTAVPTRLARIYSSEELRAKQDHLLVFAMYGLLWALARRLGGTRPIAVVLRHNRFAEVLVAHRQRVYFANRCVAFDTQPEQIHTLWESVRADLETVQRDQRINIGQVISVGWIGACEMPSWPQEWLERHTAMAPPFERLLDDLPQAVSLPLAATALRAYQSISPPLEIALFYARRGALAVNAAMTALAVLLAIGAAWYWASAQRLEVKVDGLRQQMNQVQSEMAKLPVVGPEVSDRLKFAQTLDQARRQPAYQELVNDLTASDFYMLRVTFLKVDYGPDAVRVALFGDIEAPFEQAHGGYKKYLDRLTRKGYRIEESRFETQISKSQVVLKLIRTLA